MYCRLQDLHPSSNIKSMLDFKDLRSLHLWPSTRVVILWGDSTRDAQQFPMVALWSLTQWCFCCNRPVMIFSINDIYVMMSMYILDLIFVWSVRNLFGTIIEYSVSAFFLTIPQKAVTSERKLYLVFLDAAIGLITSTQCLIGTHFWRVLVMVIFFTLHPSPKKAYGGCFLWQDL